MTGAVQLQRVNRVISGIKRWERKEKLAKDKINQATPAIGVL